MLPHMASHHKSNPGSGWSRCFLIATLILYANGTTYHVQLTLEEVLSQLENGCIPGVLVAEPLQPPVILKAPLQDHTVTCGGDECQTKTIQPELEMPGMGDGTKEKTPMCLVNELARYNKIPHIYNLTNESGPPHQKKFNVTLKLGEEEYVADGASIKKAQHAAANKALKFTNYEHPPPKATKNSRLSKGYITPTVELNALAMRRGEPTTYTILEPTPVHYGQNFFHKGMYNNQHRPYPSSTDYTRRYVANRPVYNRYDNQRGYGTKGTALYRVSVKVGEREYTGEGPSEQAARHDAASKALDELRNLPIDANRGTCKAFNSEGIVEIDSQSELKSPISLVHELALKRNLTVNFEVIDEKGPPHMRTFVTVCRVGDSFSTTGEGNGKKVSKKRAAEKMLDELRTLPPTTVINAAGCPGSITRMKRKPNATKKKSRNLIKSATVTTNQEKPDTATVEEINPISRLIQIQQAKKEKEPVYVVKEERGQARRREFLMEVTVGDLSYTGSGPNKKLAKRNAAAGLLQEMGYSSQGSVRKQVPILNGDKVSNVGGSGGRQLAPGVILMNDSGSRGETNGNVPNKQSPGSESMQKTAALAKEYLNGGSNDAHGSSHAVRPKQQLLYLAELQKFKVQFNDFPKGNHSEFLTLVCLSTEPPQVCHGSGKTIELSHDMAAQTALKSLSEMGLDSVINKKENSIGPGGDQIFIGPGSGANLAKASFVNGGQTNK